MRKLVVQQWVTVDNIAAEEDGGLSFVSGEPFSETTNHAFKASVMGLIDSVDTMILGANTYAQAKGYWPYADDQGEYGELIDRMHDGLDDVQNLVLLCRACQGSMPSFRSGDERLAVEWCVTRPPHAQIDNERRNLEHLSVHEQSSLQTLAWLRQNGELPHWLTDYLSARNPALLYRVQRAAAERLPPPEDF
jgi:hypothetical protein